MPLNDAMAALMNGVRHRCALQGKLSLSDATSAIWEPNLGTVLEVNNQLGWNNCSFTKTDVGTKAVCSRDDLQGITGFYIFFDKKQVIPGKRYSFNALIRGNMELRTVGVEGSTTATMNRKLNPNDWLSLTFNFVADADFILYCKAKKDDWLELKDMHFSELGGGS